MTLYDPKTLQPVPGIAEKLDISSDGLKYTFHLRTGVKFQNGRAVTADDVLFSLNRLADPQQATTYATSLILGSVEGFNHVYTGHAMLPVGSGSKTVQSWLRSHGKFR